MRLKCIFNRLFAFFCMYGNKRSFNHLRIFSVVEWSATCGGGIKLRFIL